jgi:hypothetical protein
LYSIYYCTLNIFDLLIIDYETNKNTFLNYHNIHTIIPIACDILLVYANSHNEIAVPYLLTNIVIGILFIVKPFYKLDHFAFHIALIVQNYYVSMSNTRLT